MGRKIPAKKHHGVKDPLEQQARRLQSVKCKINAPPKDPEEQPVPRSLTRLFAFQHKHDSAHRRNNKNRNAMKHAIDAKSGSNPIASLKKLPGESGRSFSLRINSAVRALHTDITEYPHETEADDVKGQRMEALRQRRRKRAAARAPRPAPPAPTPPALPAPRAAPPELQYERVAFGDVAHAPPALARAAADRPGRRDLLLTRLLRPGAGAAPPRAGAAPPAERLRRERARLDAVHAYRALKASARSRSCTQ